MDTIFTISGIFFLYSFLVGLSGITINGVHGARNKLHQPSSSKNFPVRTTAFKKKGSTFIPFYNPPVSVSCG